jgi:hypothetical protein
MLRLRAAALGCILAWPAHAFAQQQPSWEDLALQAQKNATLDQMAANAMITNLQAEVTSLKAELAKAKTDKPKDEPK